MQSHTGEQLVKSVTVTPQTGPGSFSAEIKGEALNGTHTLRCYVSTDNGGETKFTETLTGHNSDDPHSTTFNFNESFKFTYTVPGTHSLVCLIDVKNDSADSADFVVTASSAATPTPTPASTPQSAKWYIRVYNVDDLGTAYVNGSKIIETQFAQMSIERAQGLRQS